MATWEDQTSPLSKFENSPAESFLSTPGEMYPSLFAASTPPPASSTMNPLEMMTPPSMADDIKPDPDAALVSALAATIPLASTPEAAPTAASKSADSEKKPAKKRKSWGQVLPEPKTNLPPRKRAKTEDEKEQRRVERVLRNRRAAQSSRERKRQEVEALEIRNKELEARLLEAQNDKIKLIDELRFLRQQAGVVTRTPMPLDNLHTDSPTLSKELFSSQDLSLSETALTTVDPSSLSPKPLTTETPDAAPTAADDGEVAGGDAPSSDLAQHPAAMLYDLQCQKSAEARLASASSTTLAPQMLIIIIWLASICQRPMTQIALSLKAGLSLPTTQSILKTIIWVVTRPRSSTTSCNSSPMERSHPTRSQTSATRLPTLRIRSLQKLLTCSPNLARPLKDATMAALRLAASKRRDDRVAANGEQRLDASEEEWLEGFQLPSWEVLMALWWAIECEESKQRSNTASHDPVTNICSSTTARTSCMDLDNSICSFTKVHGKRRREGVNMFAEFGEAKRQRRN